MKLYDFALAPNPRRVRMFLAEKGIEVPSVQINTRQREQFSDTYRAINPYCQVPALEVDDGTIITESVSICRYFEEIHPEPLLMGRDPLNKAIVDMWNRRVEFGGYQPVAEAVRNSLPMFEDRGLAGMPGGVPQIAALADRGKMAFGRFLTRIDDRLGDSEFIAGDDFTIADITAFVAIEFGGLVDFGIPMEDANVARWQDQVAARPSAKV